MSYGGANLGGGVNGISVPQTNNSMRESEDATNRKELRDVWNTNILPVQKNADGVEYSRVATPFRAAMNMDDYLSRKNYVCGGPGLTQADKPGMKNLIRHPASHCDDTGIAGASCNPRFVADSSDYVRFRKMSALNRTYNDRKAGGDQSHGSQSHYRFAIRHK